MFNRAAACIEYTGCNLKLQDSCILILGDFYMGDSFVIWISGPLNVMYLQMTAIIWFNSVFNFCVYSGMCWCITVAFSKLVSPFDYDYDIPFRTRPVQFNDI